MKKFLLAASTITVAALAGWSADAADIALRKAAAGARIWTARIMVT